MVFQGGSDPERAAVFQQLGLAGGNRGNANERPQRFVLPLGECEFQISAIVDELCTDPFMVCYTATSVGLFLAHKTA